MQKWVKNIFSIYQPHLVFCSLATHIKAINAGSSAVNNSTDAFGPLHWAEEKLLAKYVYAAYRISSLLTEYANTAYRIACTVLYIAYCDTVQRTLVIHCAQPIVTIWGTLPMMLGWTVKLCQPIEITSRGQRTNRNYTGSYSLRWLGLRGQRPTPTSLTCWRGGQLRGGNKGTVL